MRALFGVFLGAIIGGLIWGPLGALFVGCALGLVGSYTAQSDREKNQDRLARRIAEETAKLHREERITSLSNPASTLGAIDPSSAQPTPVVEPPNDLNSLSPTITGTSGTSSSIEARSLDSKKKIFTTDAIIGVIVIVLIIAFLSIIKSSDFSREAELSPLPSMLIGQSAPETNLPPVTGLVRNGMPVPGLIKGDFQGGVTVLYFWSSWCLPCQEELALWSKLANDKRIPIYAINYKDQPQPAIRFLERYGNPFAKVGMDISGSVSKTWGLSGVPETVVIGQDGRIAYKLVGPIDNEDTAKTLGVQIEKALKF